MGVIFLLILYLPMVEKISGKIGNDFVDISLPLSMRITVYAEGREDDSSVSY
jgi:hypothetical protein